MEGKKKLQVDRCVTRNAWRAGIKSVECDESHIKALVKSKGKWQCTAAPRWRHKQVSELPTFRAHVSFVGGADVVFALGHNVAWVSLGRDHIDPRGVSRFNGTGQKRWERESQVIIIVWQTVGRTEKQTVFVFLSGSPTVNRGDVFTPRLINCKTISRKVKVGNCRRWFSFRCWAFIKPLLALHQQGSAA